MRGTRAPRVLRPPLLEARASQLTPNGHPTLPALTCAATRSLSAAKRVHMDGTRQRMSIRTMDLGHDQILMLEGAPGTRVRVIRGAIWLTGESDHRNHVPASGDEVVIRPC